MLRWSTRRQGIHLLFSTANCRTVTGAGMAQCESARLPPLCPGFDSRTRRHMWVRFVVGSRSFSEGFSPGSPVFLPPQKPTFLNFGSMENSRATGLSVEDCCVSPSLNKVDFIYMSLYYLGPSSRVTKPWWGVFTCSFPFRYVGSVSDNTWVQSVYTWDRLWDKWNWSRQLAGISNLSTNSAGNYYYWWSLDNTSQVQQSGFQAG